MYVVCVMEAGAESGTEKMQEMKEMVSYRRAGRKGGKTNMDTPGMNLYIFQVKMPRIGFQSRVGGRS